MTEQTNQNQANQAEGQENQVPENQGNPANELDLLKQRARLMGVEFSNNIGIDTLRQRIADKLASSGKSQEEEPEEEPQEGGAPINALTGETETPKPMTAAQKKMALRQQLIRENMRLVRCRITNMDPKKKDLPGEIITVANEYIGTVRKYVPFGEATEDGYHIPYCIYKMLKRRRFLNIRTVQDRNSKIPRIESGWAREFAIEILDPLTKEELNRLATAQAAAGSIDNASQ